MDLSNLTLAQVAELSKTLCGGAKTADPTTIVESDKKIVVLDRGFVYVGDVSVFNDWVLIKNAQNLRIWGTTRGLGELRNGPLSGTKLDDVGSVRAPLRALISLIDVDAAKWNASK
jgi:hypothetical protein